MFKEYDMNPQKDVLSSTAKVRQGSFLWNFPGNNSWCNLHREYVLMRINKNVFSTTRTVRHDTSDLPLIVYGHTSELHG